MNFRKPRLLRELTTSPPAFGGAANANAPQLRLAYVACLPLPQDRVPANQAFSQAGTLLQEHLLENLKREGVSISKCFILRAISSFPRSRILFSGFQKAAFRDIPAVMMPFLNLAGLKTITVGISSTIALAWWVFRQPRGEPRAIVCYNLANPPAFAVLAAALLTRTPVYALVADLIVPGDGVLPDTLARRFEFWMQVKCLHLFDGLIVLTHKIAEDFAPRVPRIQLEGGVPDRDGSDVESQNKDEDECFTIMYSGTLSSFKGVPLLLESFEYLADHRFRLWITGSGESQGLVEAASQRDHRIAYLGKLPYPEVLELYSRASVLVNPHASHLMSAKYVFPSKLLEYLLAGRPVISTVSTPEVATTYGPYIFALYEEEPEALAKLIERVASLPPDERRMAGERGQRFVLDNKSWSAQSKRIASFLKAPTLQ